MSTTTITTTQQITEQQINAICRLSKWFMFKPPSWVKSWKWHGHTRDYVLKMWPTFEQAEAEIARMNDKIDAVIKQKQQKEKPVLEIPINRDIMQQEKPQVAVPQVATPAPVVETAQYSNEACITENILAKMRKFLPVELNNSSCTMYSIGGNTYLQYNKRILPVELLYNHQLADFKIDLSTNYKSFRLWLDNLKNDESVLAELKKIKSLQDDKPDYEAVVFTGRKTKMSFNREILDLDVDMYKQLLAKPKISFDNSLVSALKNVIVAVGSPKTVYKHEFLNINLVIKQDKIELQTTDGFRIHTQTVNILTKDETILEGCRIELDQKEVANIIKMNPSSISLLVGEEKEMKKSEGEAERIILTKVDVLADDVLVADVVPSTVGWPNAEKIFPRSFASEFTFNKKEFVDLLKKVNTTAKKINPENEGVSIKYNTKEEVLDFLVKDQQENILLCESLTIDYQTNMEGFEQSFNSSYLLDAVKALDSKEGLFCANAGKPCMIFQKGEPTTAEATQRFLISGLK